MVAAKIVLLVSLVGLPPPLCRGRTARKYTPTEDRSPSRRALAEVQAAYDALCPQHNCGRGDLFENPTAGNNAFTWVSGLRDGQYTRAKIVYSAQFLNGLDQSFGPGASFGVLAHEVGHHLTAALSMRQKFDASWTEELRADYLAGCALGRAGRAPDELENALRALASVATKSHPSFQQRNPVVQKGYRECQKGLPKSQPRFGLGALYRKEKGCWRYRYRLKEQMEFVGPVAAPRLVTGGFKTQEGCEAHRQKRRERVTKACRCVK